MVQRAIADLRERRLWPVALVLLLAIVAVPLVLAKGTTGAVAPPPAPVVAGASVSTSLPSVSVSPIPTHSDLRAQPHDPFTPLSPVKGGGATVTGVTATASVTAGVNHALTGTPSTTSTPSTSSSTAGSGGTGGSGNPAGGQTTTPTRPKIPAGHAKPAPTGLGSRQVYDVTLAATQPDGGLDTTPSLERLSPVPSAQQPLLVELGVVQGGRRVLFAVLPGTNFSGPGTCIPGQVDCEVLSLGVNQVETVWGADSSAATDLAVTAIGVGEYRSGAAALQARRAESQPGRQLLAAANLQAPSLFPYDLNLGALVDLRNLTAEGA